MKPCKIFNQTAYKDTLTSSEDKKILLSFKGENFISIDLKKFAYMQLLNENVPNSNIDISNLCTYELNHEFYSWRKSKHLLAMEFYKFIVNLNFNKILS